MTNSQILTKAIEKAGENGYGEGKEHLMLSEIIGGGKFPKYIASSIIFSHSFAKAFFQKDWKTHLQNMVVLESPLDYLADFAKMKE